MKIILYLEYLHFFNGILFRRVGTGLLSSYKNQKAMLKRLGISFTEKWDNNADVLMINTPWLKSLYYIRKARLKGMKIIIWSHVTAEDAADVFWFTKYVISPFKKYLTYAYGSADIVLCPSEYTRGLLLNYGLDGNKLVVLSNGVNLEEFYPNPEKRLGGRRAYDIQGLCIGTVSLVIPRKGVDTFLRLAEKFPKTRFMWYGKIYSKLMSNPLPKTLPANTRFTGYVDDIQAAFNSLDIFLFPSYEENQGMAILEAAALGLPILVRDLPVYQGWLRHNENCLKAKNDQEFERYLIDLMNDPGLRQRLGQNALVLAGQESYAVLAEKFMTLLKKLKS